MPRRCVRDVVRLPGSLNLLLSLVAQWAPRIAAVGGFLTARTECQEHIHMAVRHCFFSPRLQGWRPAPLLFWQFGWKKLGPSLWHGQRILQIIAAQIAEGSYNTESVDFEPSADSGLCATSS